MCAPRCPVCANQTTDPICAACGSVLDPNLFDYLEELEADASCAEGSCSHALCLEERTAHMERGLV